MVNLGELGTQVLIPVAGVIGIVFAVAQWVIVSKVKVTPGAANASGAGMNGYGDYLIEEEEGLNDHNVVVKCTEIQTAISEVPCLDVAHPAPPWMKEVVACLCVATPVDQLPHIDAQVAARLPPLDAVGWALGPSEGEELDLFMDGDTWMGISPLMHVSRPPG